jgi:hypothetical protein
MSRLTLGYRKDPVANGADEFNKLINKLIIIFFLDHWFFEIIGQRINKIVWQKY